MKRSHFRKSFHQVLTFLVLPLGLYGRLFIGFKSLSSAPRNCEIICQVSSFVHEDLFAQVALYILRRHGKEAFPSATGVRLTTLIPLWRGLGSSAAAIIAGVMLGNEAADLGLSKEWMSDYYLTVERHPDTIAPTLFGDFIGAFMDTAYIEIPLSEVLPELSEDADTSLRLLKSFLLFTWRPRR